MSEVERNEQISEAFAQLSHGVTGYIRPAGADAVRATVRRARRRWTVIAGVAALGLIAGPAAAFAAHGGAHPPSRHDLGGGVATVEPSAGQSSPEQGTASSEPSQSAQSSHATPDDRLSLGVLGNATLQIPAWPAGFSADCQTGAVRFVFQVLALNRTATGTISTFGTVVAGAGSQGTERVDIMTIWAIRAAAGGQVQADVGEYRPCCSMAPDSSQHQWRTYGYNGQRFTQTGGPTTFGANPNVTDLAVTGTDLVMTKQADGTWAGSSTVTVRNNGPSIVPATLLMTSDTPVSVTIGQCRVTITLPGESKACAVGSPRVGSTLTVTVAATSATVPTGNLRIYAQHVVAKVPTGDDLVYPDLNSDNDMAVIPFRAA